MQKRVGRKCNAEAGEVNESKSRKRSLTRFLNPFCHQSERCHWSHVISEMIERVCESTEDAA